MGAVNVAPEESELRAAEPSDVASALGGLEHRYVDRGADVAAAVLESRRGRELWRVFIYAAAALLALEMYLARGRAS
jgi:hypothetical protein